VSHIHSADAVLELSIVRVQSPEALTVINWLPAVHSTSGSNMESERSSLGLQHEISSDDSKTAAKNGIGLFLIPGNFISLFICFFASKGFYRSYPHFYPANIFITVIFHQTHIDYFAFLHTTSCLPTTHYTLHTTHYTLRTTLSLS